ncbi:hypothetical protein [Clostridium sp. KNHs205]|jgi:hypothetical protein|uniref:hypothetical protein n=1 Tax=Clostridium sp. KNHs205 TaxID=1449050 RepID=UPI00051BB508|nr:hypothetical protein [Clostridium sp. KNHs205]
MIISISCWFLGLIFVVLGIIAGKSKKPAGIYSNIKAPGKEEINDLKAYNKAVGRLIMGYGILQIMMGVLLIKTGEKSAGLVMTFSFFFGGIVMMIIYEIAIGNKYINRKTGRHN